MGQAPKARPATKGRGGVVLRAKKLTPNELAIMRRTRQIELEGTVRSAVEDYEQATGRCVAGFSFTRIYGKPSAFEVKALVIERIVP